MLTRREFAPFILVPFSLALGIGTAAVQTDQEMQSGGDTWIRIMQEPVVDSFFVGVRTKVKADWARVQIFYRQNLPGLEPPALRSKESLAPVAGESGYGASELFPAEVLPHVEFIRVTFLRDAGQREFRS